MNREVICFDAVAPARERGLKSILSIGRNLILCRSREGAWIEMICRRQALKGVVVAPARERGLKFITEPLIINKIIVAPARERGLKYRG